MAIITSVALALLAQGTATTTQAPDTAFDVGYEELVANENVAARKAIETLHDSDLNGRMIFVREDREAETSRAPARAGGGGQCKVFVGNLPHETTWQELKDIFRKAGEVLRADVEPDAAGKSKGHGIVQFETVHAAEHAITGSGAAASSRPSGVR